MCRKCCTGWACSTGPGSGSAAAGAAPAKKGGVAAAVRQAIPLSLRQAVTRCLPRSVHYRLSMKWVNSAIDWERSQAFCIPNSNEAYVRLNRRGREPRGTCGSRGGGRSAGPDRGAGRRVDGSGQRPPVGGAGLQAGPGLPRPRAAPPAGPERDLGRRGPDPGRGGITGPGRDQRPSGIRDCAVLYREPPSGCLRGGSGSRGAGLDSGRRPYRGPPGDRVRVAGRRAPRAFRRSGLGFAPEELSEDVRDRRGVCLDPGCDGTAHEPLVRRMCDVQACRGPDDSGVTAPRARLPGQPPPRHHRPLVGRPACRCATRRAATGSPTTARSTTSPSCARELEALGARVPLPHRHRGRLARLRWSGASAASTASSACSPSPSGTAQRGALFLARDRYRHQAALLRPRRRQPRCSPPRSRRCWPAMDAAVALDHRSLVEWLLYRNVDAFDTRHAPRGVFQVLPGHGTWCWRRGLTTHRVYDVVEQVAERSMRRVSAARPEAVVVRRSSGRWSKRCGCGSSATCRSGCC